MATPDFNAPRLYLDHALAAGLSIQASSDQANYLVNVLRLASGDAILVFNGRDGEWLATLERTGKRGAMLCVMERVRDQEGGPDMMYLFAPLKRSRMDYMVQKATEMGVARLSPVLTRRTIAERVNTARMRANVVEAAEQCGILRLPSVEEPRHLDRALADWDEARLLVFCDEAAPVANPVAALAERQGAAVAVLVGPEGGFAPEERDLLLSKSYTLALSLGPRILRADTAAVAALALVNATVGDWR